MSNKLWFGLASSQNHQDRPQLCGATSLGMGGFGKTVSIISECQDGDAGNFWPCYVNACSNQIGLQEHNYFYHKVALA